MEKKQLSIHDFMATNQTLQIKAGLEDLVVAQSALSLVDGENGALIYGGYSIHDLADHATFEEVCHLLWFGKLPTKAELFKLDQELKSERKLSTELKTFIKNHAAQAQPMEFIRTAVSFDGFFDKKKNDNSHDTNLKKAIALTAKIPGMVAAYNCVRSGKDILEPDSKLSHAENFLYMLNGKKPTTHEAKAMDCALILHADHGFNASTFSARVTIATLSDMHSAITSAIGTLKGPLHGGANTEVMFMLKKIGDVSKVEAYIKNLFEKKQKIMGFGHRVYRRTDPRVIHLKNLSKDLNENSGNKQLKMYYDISEKMEKLVKDIKGLNSNVDFYSASLYHALGIPSDMFTTLFVISRVSGWTAHVLEQLKFNRLIRPKCEYTGPMGLKIMPLEKRV